MVTIGLVANVYQEVNALPGWLETHLPFFDDVRVLHSGPNGKFSDDGTIELLAKWGVRVDFSDMNEGFGVVRTRALRMSKCDYVMLLDADERFYHTHKVVTLSGEGTPQDQVDKILSSYHYRDGNQPDWKVISTLGDNLRVDYLGALQNQGKYLRDILEEGHGGYGDSLEGIAVTRRHWHDLKMQHPCQDWRSIPDWQLRLVRNSPNIYFDPHTKMHEKLVGASRIYYADTSLGPFFEHFHFFFKGMEEEQRAKDIEIYDSLSR